MCVQIVARARNRIGSSKILSLPHFHNYFLYWPLYTLPKDEYSTSAVKLDWSSLNVLNRNRTRGKSINGIQRNEIGLTHRAKHHARRRRTQDHHPHSLQFACRGERFTPVHHRNGPGAERSHLLRSEDQERRRRHYSRQETSGTRPSPPRSRNQGQASRESLGRNRQ